MKLNIRPAYRYQFGGFLKSAAVFYLIMMAIITVFLISASRLGRNSYSYTNFTAYSIATAVFMFVLGIVNIRSDLRLCLQLGVSRRTVFISAIAAVISVSLVLGATGELLTGVTQAAARSIPNCYVSDLYQLIYLGSPEVALTLVQRILSALFNASLFIGACFFGMFFSLMFWRLNKLWTIIAAIAIPFVLNGGPALLVKLGVDLNPFVEWTVSSPFNFILICLAGAAFFAIIDWLLLRRANIKATK